MLKDFQYTECTQKNGAVYYVISIYTAPLFCVYSVVYRSVFPSACHILGTRRWPFFCSKQILIDAVNEGKEAVGDIL